MESTDTSCKHETCDYRIQVDSKRELVEQSNKYKELLKKVLDGQAGIPEETKKLLLQELLANFDAAVQANVSVKGHRWDDAPEDEDEGEDLENKLDDVVVETCGRRRRYPKKILPFVVESLKAQRRLMGLYKDPVKPQEIFKDPCQDGVMERVSAGLPEMAEQAQRVMKAIQTLQQQASGLSQVINTQPSQASLQIHKEVFGHSGQSDAGLPFQPTTVRQPIKRAVEETLARKCYVPPCKKTQ